MNRVCGAAGAGKGEKGGGDKRVVKAPSKGGLANSLFRCQEPSVTAAPQIESRAAALTLETDAPYDPRAHSRGFFPRPPPLPLMLENALSRCPRGVTPDLRPVAHVLMRLYSPICQRA